MSAGLGFRALRAIAIGIISLLSIGFPLQALAGTSYIYDELGRVVQATHTDGAVVVYRYDANGNITTILRQSASALSIANVSPTVVHAGSLLTIVGTGFGATAPENVVTIGGAAAVVSSASATSLTAAVPASANSGPVTVTVGSSTAISPNAITVLRPLISSVSPLQVSPGTAITLTGSNLKLVPGTSLSVAGANASITSITNTQIVFSAPSASGPVRVQTSYGDAESTQRLIAIPAAIGAANVLSSMQLAQGASGSLSTGQPNKYGIFTFNGTAGQYLSVQLSSLTLVPSNTSATYKFYSPAHALLASGSVSMSSPTIHLPALPSTGTYLIAFSGTGTVQLQATLEVNSVVPVDGTSGTFSTTVAKQSTRLVFAGTAGANVGVGVRALSMPNDYLARVSVLKPDGGALVDQNQCNENVGGCQFTLRSLPATGNYTIVVWPATAASTMTFRLTLSAPVQTPLTLNTPENVSLLEGQYTLMPFTVTAGQTMVVNASSIVTSPTGRNVYLYVLDANGNSVAGTSTTSGTMTLNLRNMAAGNYTAHLVPYYGDPTTAQVVAQTGIDSTVPVDGTSATFSTSVPSQIAYFKFAGTAGQNVGIGLRALSLPSDYLAYVSVLKPDGGALVNQSQCQESVGGCQFTLRNLPATGTYTIVVWPATAASTMTFRLTLSAPIQTPLTLNTPENVSLLEGQYTLMPFTVTAGQTMAVNASSIVTSPAGRNVYLYVLDANGNSVASTWGAAGTMTLNLPSMAAGTYTAHVVSRYGESTTAQVIAQTGIDSIVPVDGTSATFSTSVPSQIAYFKFAGTAGQNVGIGLRALSLPNDYLAYVSVIKPDGSALINQSQCTESVGGCQLTLFNLPATGTYSIIVWPATAVSTMSFRLTLSAPLQTALTLNTPQSVSLIEGQYSLMPFTVTAGQTMAVYMSSIVTSPAGRQVYLYVLNASGSTVGYTSTTTSTMTLNLRNLAAGTYFVQVISRYGEPTTAQVVAQTGLDSPVAVDGSSATFSTSVPDQIAYFTFAGTAGQNVGIGLRALSLPDDYFAYVNVYKPDGGLLVNQGQCYESSGGCQFALLNLPATGTYSIALWRGSAVSTMSFRLTLSGPIQTALALDTPQSVSLVEGQYTLMPFTATAGQNVSVSVASLVTTPTGKPVDLYVLNASRVVVGQTSTSSGAMTLNLTNLAAGTYSVQIVPRLAYPATLQVTIH